MKYMKNKWLKLACAAVLAVGLMPLAAFAGNSPVPPRNISAKTVEKMITVPNSIQVTVEDEAGNPLRGGTFELLDSSGGGVVAWNGQAEYVPADPSAFFNGEEMSFLGDDLFQIGDMVPANGIYYAYGDGANEEIHKDAYLMDRYNTYVEKYISYGDKMNLPTTTVPANELWIHVDNGYRNTGLGYQVMNLNNVPYNLSDIAGGVEVVQNVAARPVAATLTTDVGDGGGESELSPLTASDNAEEYVQLTIDLHKYLSMWVKSDGTCSDSKGNVFHYGAPRSVGAVGSAAYLQITSGAVTNFVALDGTSTATIYVKKGDYTPLVNCKFKLAGASGGAGGSASGSGLAGTNSSFDIFDWVKHTIYLMEPPATDGTTIGYIPAGTYTLHQTSAAPGYAPADDMTVVIRDSYETADIQQIELVNAAVHTHTFAPDWSHDATHHWHAATCGHDVVADKAPHDWGAWQELTPPTGSAPGLKRHVCNTCGHMDTEVIPPLSHVHAPALVNGQVPTCIDAGWKDYYQCDCGDFFEDAAGALPISDLAAWKAVGGNGYLAPLGHEWDSPVWAWWNNNTQASVTLTCTHDASHTDTFDATVATAVTNPTCTTEGLKTYTASVDVEGRTWVNSVSSPIAATGHDWGAPTYTWSDDYSTCTATRVCNNDPSHVEEAVAVVSATETKAAPAESAGEMTYTATFAEAWASEQTMVVSVSALDTDVVTIPKTGDATPVALWAVVALLALGAAFCLRTWEKKKD